ncbi:MAG: phosphatase PAP2 family protein [Ruminococcus sp.]|nr:phosphatase PAP2 family protein [Ruminococcus sp.]
MRRKRRILPKYAYIPVILCLIWNELVYHVSRIFTNRLHHFDFSSSVDSLIPFEPSFIIIYNLSYILWAVGFVIFARENRKLCNEMFAAEMIGKTICLICFIAIPTEMVRANICKADFFSYLTSIMYSIDEPNNLFPSIHCMESWLCFRGAFKCKKIHSIYSAAWFILATLICLSTVFVKQHVFVDIFAGIFVAEAGLYLSRWFDAGSVFDIIRVKLIRLKKEKKSKKIA